ncbi:DUF3427 domain-containing protein [Gordonia hydrophobica]|uniref:DUF3427 domain-containing protein n=1 Tax=Gordonia hydrophobica TaxID=40516 RepID=A0ABZ2U2P2_9ACTN|nr:DEAD/DEAH box helicase [Gordonia hydrophobica]MBM7368981.1 superfamily II DNA or RNA helicase/HKD family nuclease [Gordonia hydrophobica]
MQEGIYEKLVTKRLNENLVGLDAFGFDTASVDNADQPHVLARHVSEVVFHHLDSIKDPGKRLSAANRLLADLISDHDLVDEPVRQLTRVHRPAGPGVVDRTAVRPTTPLSEVALLTNASGEPSIGHELPAELASADSVDLVCAFIRWSGVRLLEAELRALAESGTPFRIITTTYLGSTERETLDRLVRQYGAEVRVQYDNLRTRLHAKAWLFHRNSGYDTAYIGSSNLSNAALIDGVEWNVRLSRVSTPSLIEKFRSTFDTYWHDDPSFEEYDPDRDRDRLDDALAEASGTRSTSSITLNISGLEVRPYPYQQVMLDEIQAERQVHGRHRNLVVAATGTGKTVLAALDYRRTRDVSETRPRLLFVAHRHEILAQAQRTYREVLADPNFGETYVAGTRPERWDHVFASVQSLNAYGIGNIPAEHFDIVVIDEFHHAAARTYSRILSHLRPAELLGLTATPERADGADIIGLFDGRIATELRLWDALEAELLCPFHYFGIADGTDLARLTWKRGRYEITELDNLYTGDDRRAHLILSTVRDKIVAPHQMRALGFCVSVGHAEYMAKVFNQAGVPATAVSGSTRDVDRIQAIADLKDRSINIIFSVDVFNEGLDIKDVDTILMLRPTESVTIFLQQLGRGLRRTETKPVLTVLDFVGNQRDEFRWDLRLRALTGGGRGALARNVENRFPTLPSGCRIVLDEATQSHVLKSLKRQISMRWADIVAEYRALNHLDLPSFVDETGIPLARLTKNDKSWTQLRRDAGALTGEASALESEILKRNRAFAHVDDSSRVEAYRRLLDSNESYDHLSTIDQRLADMLVFSVWPTGGSFASVNEALDSLRSEPEACREILSITNFTFDLSRQQTSSLDGELSQVPLQLHAHYQREEILAGLGVASFESRPGNFREGVKYIADLNVDAFFVNLIKTDTAFSPTTMYRDYPISRSLFHWESQSTTSITSATGQRYINGTSTVLLFVRHQKQGEFGPMPYTFLGPAELVDHQGERPIAITWRLDHEMPAEFFNTAKLVAS